ncbi:MAG: helix-turn-helix transcriptional regulator [Clostridiaceae bacterium]|nr:helix-turn-helix transcriptional regulator [Clostridiaceae bacterium]
MELSYEAIGKRVKHFREKKNITQDKLSELTDLSIQHISNIERAHSKMSIEALVNIANALEVTTDELMCDSIYKSKEIFCDELADLLNQADTRELKVIISIVKALLPTLKDNYRNE